MVNHGWPWSHQNKRPVFSSAARRGARPCETSARPMTSGWLYDRPTDSPKATDRPTDQPSHHTSVIQPLTTKTNKILGTPCKCALKKDEKIIGKYEAHHVNGIIATLSLSKKFGHTARMCVPHRCLGWHSRLRVDFQPAHVPYCTIWYLMVLYGTIWFSIVTFFNFPFFSFSRKYVFHVSVFYI